MAEFKPAVEFVLKNEGGFVDNPNDSGGVTNFGISLRFLREIPDINLRKYGIFVEPDLLTVGHVNNLTKDQAELIYKGEFWDAAPFSEIIDRNICNYIFDCCVLHGLSQGIKIAQRALWAYYEKKDIVVDDGVLGAKTMTLINDGNEVVIICCLMAERAGYMRLVAFEKSKDGEFLNGWLNRCYRI
jgi:lysozyme family protein